MRRAIYPGSFDPITYGHLDVIRRAAKIFDELIVAVALNEEKKPLFSLKERLEMIRVTVKDFERVKIDHFNTLLVDYCRVHQIDVVIRGLRAISDFEFEFQMALTNKKLYEPVETVFMMPNESYSYLSSRMIKEIVSLGGRVQSFVPAYVEKKLREKLFRGKSRK
jgi:pantetheine-phosphate adenylyltransferase